MKLSIFIIIILLTAVSCKTYTISPDSFRDQIINTDNIKMKTVEINNPLLFGDLKYSANHIKDIVVIDKKGNELSID